MNTILPKLSVSVAYLTYISFMLDDLNAIDPIEQPESQSESTSAQVSPVVGGEFLYDMVLDVSVVIQSGGCAPSVPATKNANTMTQENIEPSCGSAGRL